MLPFTDERDLAVTCLRVSVSGGTSQFGFLELSQSQDLCGGAVNSQDREENSVAPQPDGERRSRSGVHGEHGGRPWSVDQLNPQLRCF